MLNFSSTRGIKNKYPCFLRFNKALFTRQAQITTTTMINFMIILFGNTTLKIERNPAFALRDAPVGTLKEIRGNTT